MAVTYLKRGKEMEAAAKQADAQTEAKKASSGGTRRFWMPDDSERRITFLDGDFAESGLLDVPAFWEHQLKTNGHWRNWFLCTKEHEPCPL